MEHLLRCARLLQAAERLEKRSKNVRAQLAATPAQVKHQRMLDYLRRQGIEPRDTVPQTKDYKRAFGVDGDRAWARGEPPDFERPWGRTGYKTTASGHQEPVYGDLGGPDRFGAPSFPHAHEAGHMLMTPPGRSAASYQEELDRRRFETTPAYSDWDMSWGPAEEEGANLVENGLWRRAGAGSPITRITDNQWRINRGAYKRSYELNAQKRRDAKDRPIAERTGRPAQRAWDEGRLEFGDGGVRLRNTVDARINARAAGQPASAGALTPSRPLPLR